MTTEKGGAPAETDAIRAKSGVGSGSVEGPLVLSARFLMNLSKEVVP